MKKKKLTFSAKRIVRRVRDASALAFDSGVTNKVTAFVRRKFSSLSLRCAGVFLFTLGLYSAAISIAKMMVWDADPAMDLVASVLCALSAIPLLFSSSTLGESLVKTKTGQTILSFLGIREEAVRVDEPFGRANISFIFGVGVGTLAFFMSSGYILLCVMLLVLCGVVLTVPETAVMFSAVLIPMGLDIPCVVLSVCGMVSFIIKYLRYKRSAVGYSHDKAAGVLLLSVILGVAVSIYGKGSASYIALLFVYFIISFSPSGRVLGGKLVATLVAAGGITTAVIEAFAIVGFAIVKEKESISEIVRGISVCDTEVLSTAACALIPVAIFILVSGGALSRITAFLSAASMVSFLVMSEGYSYLMCAVVGSVCALMFCSRRIGYLVVSAGIFAMVVWVFFGGSLEAVPRLAKYIILRPEGMDSSYEYLMFGEGLTGGFGHGGSFYMAVMSRLGVVGIAVLLAFGILLVYEIISLEQKSASAGNKVYKNACVPVCGIISLLLCGIGVNIWETPEGFLLFWILCGSAGACISGGNKRADKLLEADREEKTRTAAGVVIK